MKWFAKKVFDGGGKDLKNRCKSYGYFFKFFNLVKIGKIFSDAQSKPSDGCTEKNTASRRCLVNEKLRFAVHERRASAGGYFSEFTVSWVCEKIQNLYQKLTFVAYYKVGGVGTRATRIVDFCLVRFVRFLGKVGVRVANVEREMSESTDHRAAQIDYSQNPSLMVLWNKWSFRTANRGAILIEFAVCMPVLIILLFYINDLVRIKRYYSQTEFVAQQFANIIQNISQKRTDKKITKNDLNYITTLVTMSSFPGISKAGFRVFINLFYVKGLNGGSAKQLWMTRVDYINTSPITPTNISWYSNPNQYSITKQSGENITYPSLKITPNETKMIVDICLARHKSFNGVNNEKQAFDLHLLEPKSTNGNGSWFSFFNSIVIFTPKPGLFSETAPS